MKTPGVYTVEKHAFPSSVVEVATAVPVFIGHTEFAEFKETPLKGRRQKEGRRGQVLGFNIKP